MARSTSRTPGPGSENRATCTVLALSSLALLITGAVLYAGPPDPPAGPVTSTYKTLTEVEPRTAINAVNTPGDADSVFKISQPGSYYLTGNITGVEDKHGIEIAASGVTLDLMGFDLIGVSGSQSGVIVDLFGLTGITVSNGTVREWGESGVDLGSNQGPPTTNCRVVNLRANGNGTVRPGLASPSASRAWWPIAPRLTTPLASTRAKLAPSRTVLRIRTRGIRTLGDLRMASSFRLARR